MTEENIREGFTEDETIDMTEEEIINKLLEPTDAPEATYKIERLGIHVTLKGLGEKEIQRIRKECTKTHKSKGRITKELDSEEFNLTLIETATVKPNWNNKKLLDSLKLSSGTEFIKRKFLAGEISALGDKVMELSGYDEELEEVKN